MDDEKKVEQTEAEQPSMVSEPDENGVRYYNTAAVQKSVQNTKSHTLRNSLIVFGCIILVIAAIGVSCNSMSQNIMEGLYPTVVVEEVELPDYPYIASLEVVGTIQTGNTDSFGTASGYQHDWTLSKMDELIADPNCNGIIFYVDTPGGSVYEIDELYLKITEFQETRGCPVYSVMGSMAASGGYYISAPCDKIVANRNTWTGSIGVTMGTFFDVSEFLDKYGVNTYTINSGANKGMGGSFEPMTEEQQAIFQSLIDEAYYQFVDIVVEGRELDRDKVIQLADGRIYTAQQALDAGLIDEIGDYDYALSDMMKAYQLEDCEVIDIYYPEQTSVFSSLLGEIGKLNISGNGDVAAMLKLMEESNDFEISYMCEVAK